MNNKLNLIEYIAMKNGLSEKKFIKQFAKDYNNIMTWDKLCVKYKICRQSLSKLLDIFRKNKWI